MTYVLYAETSLFSIVVLTVIACMSMSMSFYNSLSKRLYTASMWFSVAAMVCDFIWSMSKTESFSLSQDLLWVINFLFFTFFELSGLAWFLCIDCMGEKPAVKNKAKLFAVSLPAVAVLVLLVISAKTGFIFGIDGNLNYVRGQLFPIQVVLSFGYAVAAAICAFRSAKLKKNYPRRRELRMIPLYTLPLIVCGIIQMFTSVMPIGAVGIVISYLVMYLSFLQSLVCIDPLTGIGNYRETMSYLKSKIGNLSPNDNFYLFFLDVDYFKQINDTYGHRKGDEVLISIAEALNGICAQRGAFCARYGGDEFVLAHCFESDDDVFTFIEELKETIERKCKDYSIDGRNISVSVGHSRYTFGNDTAEDLILRADRSMYKEKVRRKVH